MPSCSPPHLQHPTARQRKRSTLIMTKPTNPYVHAYACYCIDLAVRLYREHQAQQAETPEAVPV